MVLHPLFDYLDNMGRGEYKCNLDGTEYIVKVFKGRTNKHPEIEITYNDCRGTYNDSDADGLCERESECIHISDDNESVVYYCREKRNVKSLIDPNYCIDVEDSTPEAYPFSEGLTALLDRALQLVQTAEQISS